MKPVYQTVFNHSLGDCFRACVASVFEFPINHMPNFWEFTQDVSEFWKFVDAWTVEHFNIRCISVKFNKEDLHLIDGILCIACARSPRHPDEDHAVVWQDGLVHDPHPSGAGLTEKPDSFTLFIPLDPNKPLKEQNGYNP